MIEKRYWMAFLGLMVAFAVGLAGYFAFSSNYGDGLERTMQDNGVSEGEPIYTAPMSYGDSYGGAFLAGAVGFAIVFGALFLYMRMDKARKQRL
jgi:cobalt/nickel transport protein